MFQVSRALHNLLVISPAPFVISTAGRNPESFEQPSPSSYRPGIRRVNIRPVSRKSLILLDSGFHRNDKNDGVVSLCKGLPFKNPPQSPFKKGGGNLESPQFFFKKGYPLVPSFSKGGLGRIEQHIRALYNPLHRHTGAGRYPENH